MRTVLIATTAVLVLGLAGCSTQRLPSSYDMKARDYRDGSGNACEQYAYESGRTRYELMNSLTGQAFAASNANAVAETAYQRCVAGQRGRSGSTAPTR